MQKKAIFLGECMIELNGDISSLGNSNIFMELQSPDATLLQFLSCLKHDSQSRYVFNV